MKNCQSNSDPTYQDDKVKEKDPCKSEKFHGLEDDCSNLNHSRHTSNHLKILDQ